MKVPAAFRYKGDTYEIRSVALAVLFRRARQNRPVEYDHLKRACGLRPNEISWVPGNISEWTSHTFGVFLSAFLVKKGGMYPSGGFFGLTKIPKSLKRTAAQWNAPLTKKDKAFIQQCREEAHAWALNCELEMELKKI